MNTTSIIKYPNKLKELRKAQGLTQGEVSELLDLKGENRISHWEQGIAVPHLLNLLKFTYLYDTTIEGLYPDLAARIGTYAYTTRSPGRIESVIRSRQSDEDLHRGGSAGGGGKIHHSDEGGV